jgi:phospholipase C
MALVGRRAWLSLVGGGAAATAAGVRVRSAGARDGIVAADPRIKHIVVLMLENRSFDHMLGLLMRDIPDLRGIRGGDYSNRDKNGTRFDVTDGAEYQGQLPVDPPHEFEDVEVQLYGGGDPRPAIPTMEGFALSYQRGGGDPDKVMRCFRPEQLPALTALAKHYLVCDNWFASVPASTPPNRQFAHFGTSFGQVDSTLIWLGHGKGIYGRLEAAKKRGRIYYYSPQSGTFGMTFLGSKYFGLYGDFIADCQRGTLPDYAFVEPPYHDQRDGTLAADQHPDNFVLAGDRFMWDVYKAIRSNDEVWRSTLLLIVWDEHGGLFDHVQPPRLPYRDSFRSIKPKFDFDQLGVRVGAVVVSPYVKPGVDHTLFEHASIPASVTQQFIGDPGHYAPYLREKKANTMLPLLADIAPRMEWPRVNGAPTAKAASALGAPASSFQLEHVQEVYAVLVDRQPRFARVLDPTNVRTKREVSAFMAKAMTALHPRVGADT